MSKTNRILKLDVVAVSTSGSSFAMDSNAQAIVFQARGANVQLKLGAVGDTEYWTLKDGVPQSFSGAEFSGTTFYFDVASGNHHVELMQMLRASA